MSNLDQEKDLTNTAEPETDTTIKDQQVQDAPTDEKSVEQSKQEDPRTQSKMRKPLPPIRLMQLLC